MTKENIFRVVAVLALVFGAIGFFNAGPQGPQGPRGNDGQTVGAIPGDSIDGNKFCVGGVCEYRYTQTFRNGTTTACSIEVPSFGNGRVVQLVGFDLNVRNATGSAWTWRVGTSTTGTNAVSGFLLQKTITNADVLVYSASSTPVSGAIGTGVFGTTTRQHINVDIGGTAVLPLTPSTLGTCVARFIEL